MRELLGRAQAALDSARVEAQRARRNLADAAADATRRCQACGRRLSMYADPRDRYCAPCHPRQEARPGAVLVGARWTRSDDARRDAHQAAVELGARGGQARRR